MCADLRACLPRHVRLRLWCVQRVDRSACRLVDSGHHKAAVRLWRLCRMW